MRVIIILSLWLFLELNDKRVQQGIRTVVATGILGRLQGDFCDTTSESWDTDLNTYRFTDSNLTGFTSLAQQMKTHDV